MDHFNNVGREVDLPVFVPDPFGSERAYKKMYKRYKIVDVSEDGRVYLIVDAFGHETLMPVSEVLQNGTNFH